ncbi:MAG: hypothetical protein KGI98_04675 [Euryarchaeota archaeon]|nr:hypothetical protein [Euryarchaeota archaeon]MDE1880458.1 hypothetical protein [Euryarchaeota archaeon]
MTKGPSSGDETDRAPRRRTLITKVLRRLPPVRLVWIFLGTLIFVGGGQSSVPGAEAWALVVAFAVALDMALQFARFRHGLRFPDAALSTAMFLVLLLQPPNAAWGSAAGDYGVLLLASTAAALVPRHALRISGRPWFNPTALGITVGYVLLALPISWQVGSWPAPHVPASREVEMVLVALLGILLTIRQPRQVWLPVSFFAVALPLEGLVLGVQNGLSVAALGTVLFSPITVFFGLWMVPEPRCAPSQTRWMWRYGLVVGALYVLLGALWSLGSTPLSAHQSWSSILPFLALLAGNTLALAARLRNSPRTTARDRAAGGGQGIPRRPPERSKEPAAAAVPGP